MLLADDMEDAAKANAFISAIMKRPWHAYGAEQHSYHARLADSPSAAAFGLHLVSIIIGIICYYAGYGILAGDLRTIPLDVSGQNATDFTHAWNAMVGDGSNTFLGAKLPVQSTRTVPVLPVELIYRGVNCLTAANLASMQKLEHELFALPGYQNDVCLNNAKGVCEKPRSVLRLFDGTYAHAGPAFAADPTFSNIADKITAAYQQTSNPNLRELLVYVLSAGACRSLLMLSDVPQICCRRCRLPARAARSC